MSPSDGGGGDLDKIFSALSSLPSLSSPPSLARSLGLDALPPAQAYGILFGTAVFVLTVAAVVTLLVMGGSIDRIKEQSATRVVEPADAARERSDRPLLLERLLLAREEMASGESEAGGKRPDASGGSTSSAPREGGAGSNGVTEAFTKLTMDLMNVAPDSERLRELHALIEEEEEESGGGGDARSIEERRREEIKSRIPDGYERNYFEAYRKCQDEPGGARIPSVPEARYEAYARAYAGCGVRASASYRRSYARTYERATCSTESIAEKFVDVFERRPGDLVGRTVRLEPLERGRHLRVMHEITSGLATTNDRAFDPRSVWGFLDCGPFGTEGEMSESWVFRRGDDEAAFAVVENVTDMVVGAVVLTKDDPWNLSVQIEPPIVKPRSDGTVEQIEACFLLIDRLFALGYRRVQLSVDTKDAGGKRLAGRLGFTHEATLPKHMIVKDSNRDSNIYGMLNSDWDRGARSVLFGKIHGAQARKLDGMNNAKEGEWEAQLRMLQERKDMAEEEARAAAEEQKTGSAKKNE